MKRLTALFFASLFMLSAVLCAAAEGATLSTPYFTLTLPEGWEYTDENPGIELDENEEYLVTFGESEDVGFVAEACLVYYEDFKDFSLWNATEDELEHYAETVLDELSDDDPRWIDTVMAGSIPFVLVEAADDDGDYLYAETMTNGYAIEMLACVLDEHGENQYPMTDDYVQTFKDVLATFKPIT